MLILVAEGLRKAYSEPQAAAAHEVERLGGWENSRRVDVLLQQLDLRAIDRNVDEMSGGERRRVALAWLLVEEPALAILDEPIIQLDADTIAWLKRRESGLTALLGTRVPDSGSMDATLARARLAWGAMRVI